MRNLTELLPLLTAAEKKDFKLFLLRTGRSDVRKDIHLFNSLLRNETNNSRSKLFGLYEKDDRNAYHSLRKRLVRQLERFIISRETELRNTREETIEGFIQVAKLALLRDSVELAGQYLTLAEERAIKNNDWELLNQVYQIRITHFTSLGENLDPLIRSWEENKKKLAFNERLMVAHGLIRQKLLDARLSGTTLNLQEVTSMTLRTIKIEDEAWKQPAFMLTIASMLRSAVISTRDYYHFESYILKMYNELNKQQSLSGKFPEIEMNFLYMISHVLYRNRKLKVCDQYLEKLEQVISTNRKRIQSGIYESRYTLLKAAIESYTGHNDLAVARLKTALKEIRDTPLISARLNMLLNLSVYLFQAENYKLSNKTMLSIQHSDKWLEKKMGIEWNFKKNLIHIILQYELGHEDIAWQMIRTIEKRYSAFLQHPFYQRASIFIGFIKTLISEPEKIRSREFALSVEKANIALPGDREDIQAMTFFCWLVSKMTGEKYYTVLLRTIGHLN